jgi:hypothetical protein
VAIEAVVLSHDSSAIFVQTAVSVRKYDAASGRELQNFGPLDGKVHGIALSPDGKQLVIAVVPNGTGALPQIDLLPYDSASGRSQGLIGRTSMMGMPIDPRGFVFTADGSSLLIHYGMGKRYIERWDVRTCEVTMKRPVLDNHHWIAYSPDRRFYFSHGHDIGGDERVIRMWHVDPWNDGDAGK